MVSGDAGFQFGADRQPVVVNVDGGVSGKLNHNATQWQVDVFPTPTPLILQQMRSSNQQTQSNRGPSGIRTSVRLIVLGVALVCIVAMMFLRPKTPNDATGAGQPSQPLQPSRNPSATKPSSASRSSERDYHKTRVQHMNPQTPKPNLDVALNAVILKFNSGGKDAEVANESLALISRLPQIPRASCMLIALISNHRIGNITQEKELAVRLNKELSGWDLPGLPLEAMGAGVTESKDVEPILTTLDSMSRLQDATQEEQDAIKSLLKQYTERKGRYQNRTR